MGTPIPKNEASFTIAEIAVIAGADAIDGADAQRAITGVCTDSRRAWPGALFVALRGDTFDGHAHARSAADLGAIAIVAERSVDVPAGVTVIRVASTLLALGALAHAHAARWRSRGDRKIVAITGSAGKTTTRVAAASLLDAMFPGQVHATTGNLNNLVGAPMVLLGLTDAHRIAVVEIGTNAPGEIAALAAMCAPDVGVVTLIAAAHTEKLGSIEGVAVEKTALYRALGPSGVAVGHAGDPRARAGVSAHPGKQIAYGAAEDVDVRIAARSALDAETSRVTLAGPDLGSCTFDTKLAGEAGALACAAAVSIAIALGSKPDSKVIAEAFGAIDPERTGAGGRLRPVRLGGGSDDRGVLLIDDSYNANPASMRASIRAAAEIAGVEKRRLVLVLGAMRELGSESDRGHDEVGAAAAASGARAILAVGDPAERYLAVIDDAGVFRAHEATSDRAAALAIQVVRPGDLVLVKGSRGVATEKVAAALRSHFASEADPSPNGPGGT